MRIQFKLKDDPSIFRVSTLEVVPRVNELMTFNDGGHFNNYLVKDVNHTLHDDRVHAVLVTLDKIQE